jgi:transposase
VEHVIRLSKTSTWRPMNGMRLSAERPLWRAGEQDVGRVEQWKRGRIVEDQGAERISGLATRPACGQTIIAADVGAAGTDASGEDDWGAMPLGHALGGNGRGDVRFRLHENTVTAEFSLRFLTQLIDHAQQPAFLKVDEHSPDLPGAVRHFLQSNEKKVRLFYLPPYSPKLNTDEQVWREVKGRGTGRLTIAGQDHMKTLLSLGLKQLSSTPRNIRSVFRNSGNRLCNCLRKST